MSTYQTVVTCDVNDGDYITEVTTICKDVKNRLESILLKIKDSEIPYDKWGLGDCKDEDNDPLITFGGVLSIEDIRFMEMYFPYFEWGVHSLIEFKIQKVEEVLSL